MNSANAKGNGALFTRSRERSVDSSASSGDEQQTLRSGAASPTFLQPIVHSSAVGNMYSVLQSDSEDGENETTQDTERGRPDQRKGDISPQKEMKDKTSDIKGQSFYKTPANTTRGSETRRGKSLQNAAEGGQRPDPRQRKGAQSFDPTQRNTTLTSNRRYPNSSQNTLGRGRNSNPAQAKPLQKSPTWQKQERPRLESVYEEEPNASWTGWGALKDMRVTLSGKRQLEGKKCVVNLDGSIASGRVKMLRRILRGNAMQGVRPTVQGVLESARSLNLLKKTPMLSQDDSVNGHSGQLKLLILMLRFFLQIEKTLMHLQQSVTSKGRIWATETESSNPDENVYLDNVKQWIPDLCDIMDREPSTTAADETAWNHVIEVQRFKQNSEYYCQETDTGLWHKITKKGDKTTPDAVVQYEHLKLASMLRAGPSDGSEIRLARVSEDANVQQGMRIRINENQILKCIDPATRLLSAQEIDAVQKRVLYLHDGAGGITCAAFRLCTGHCPKTSMVVDAKNYPELREILEKELHKKPNASEVLLRGSQILHCRDLISMESTPCIKVRGKIFMLDLNVQNAWNGHKWLNLFKGLHVLNDLRMHCPIGIHKNAIFMSKNLTDQDMHAFREVVQITEFKNAFLWAFSSDATDDVRVKVHSARNKMMFPCAIEAWQACRSKDSEEKKEVPLEKFLHIAELKAEQELEDVARRHQEGSKQKRLSIELNAKSCIFKTNSYIGTRAVLNESIRSKVDVFYLTQTLKELQLAPHLSWGSLGHRNTVEHREEMLLNENKVAPLTPYQVNKMPVWFKMVHERISEIAKNLTDAFVRSGYEHQRGVGFHTTDSGIANITLRNNRTISLVPGHVHVLKSDTPQDGNKMHVMQIYQPDFSHGETARITDFGEHRDLMRMRVQTKFTDAHETNCWNLPQEITKLFDRESTFADVPVFRNKMHKLLAFMSGSATETDRYYLLSLCKSIESVQKPRQFLTEIIDYLLRQTFDKINKQGQMPRLSMNMDPNTKLQYQPHYPYLVDRVLRELDYRYDNTDRFDLKIELEKILSTKQSEVDACIVDIPDVEQVLKSMEQEVYDVVMLAMNSPHDFVLKQTGLHLQVNTELYELHKLVTLLQFRPQVAKIDENTWREIFQSARLQHILPQVYNAILACLRREQNTLEWYKTLEEWTEKFKQEQDVQMLPSIVLYHSVRLDSVTMTHEMAKQFYNSVTQDLPNFSGKENGLCSGNVVEYVWRLLRGFFLPFKEEIISRSDVLMQEIEMISKSEHYERTLFLCTREEKPGIFNALMWPNKKPLLKLVIERDLVEILQYLWPLTKNFVYAFKNGKDIWETCTPAIWNSAFYHKSNRCLNWFLQNSENEDIVLGCLSSKPGDVIRPEEKDTVTYTNITDKSTQHVKEREKVGATYVLQNRSNAKIAPENSKVTPWNGVTLEGYAADTTSVQTEKQGSTTTDQRPDPKQVEIDSHDDLLDTPDELVEMQGNKRGHDGQTPDTKLQKTPDQRENTTQHQEVKRANENEHARVMRPIQNARSPPITDPHAEDTHNQFKPPNTDDEKKNVEVTTQDEAKKTSSLQQDTLDALMKMHGNNAKSKAEQQDNHGNGLHKPLHRTQDTAHHKENQNANTHHKTKNVLLDPQGKVNGQLDAPTNSSMENLHHAQMAEVRGG